MQIQIYKMAATSLKDYCLIDYLVYFFKPRAQSSYRIIPERKPMRDIHWWNKAALWSVNAGINLAYRCRLARLMMLKVWKKEIEEFSLVTHTNFSRKIYGEGTQQ